MATAENEFKPLPRIQKQSQAAVLLFAKTVLEQHKNFADLQNKMDAIDIAYARYKEKQAAVGSDGVDPGPEGNFACDIFADDDVTPPIVVSQVDSYVAYLTEVFLSGSPLFPVVSNPLNKKWAEQLETLIDDHSQLGGYVRQLALFIRDACKYNFSALECDWDSISQFSVIDDITAGGAGKKPKKIQKKFNKLKRLNPRNVVFDWSVSPGDISEHGDYAGYVEKVSRMRLKRMLNKWSDEHKAMNVVEAMNSSTTVVTGSSPNYRADPQISDYVSALNKQNGPQLNWDSWFEPGKKGGARGPQNMTGQYEVFTLYARIMPPDFGIQAPQPNTPQIWKLVMVNMQWVVYAERVISAYDNLPILFGQPLEDGLSYQTQSIGEGEIAFQDAAAKMFNIRFSAARRAVSDRALYIPDMIKPSDINAAVAAPKIPVHISALSNKSIQDAYHQIPFDMRGTETAIQDAQAIVAFSNQLHGVNAPRQGMFQKGNKSVREWDDTMGSSDGRMRQPALILEYQVFSPLKSMVTLNIFQYGDDAKLVSQQTGDVIEIDLAKLRGQALAFKLADGYTPKSKIANSDFLLALMNMVSQSPFLQQSYGPMLPNMFAHLASQGGVKNLEQYNPQAQAMESPGNLNSNLIQANGQPAPQAAVQPQIPMAVPGAGVPPVA